MLETSHELSSVSILADASRKVRVESQDSLMPRDISTMTSEPVDHTAQATCRMPCKISLLKELSSPPCHPSDTMLLKLEGETARLERANRLMRGIHQYTYL